jgi:rubrerythrin
MKRTSSQFLHDVQKAIDDEASAVAFYGALIEAAGDSETAPFLRRIKADEERHMKAFADLYRSRTGRRHTPEVKHVPFHSLRHGLRLAFLDEMEAQALYNDMYMIAPTQETRDFLLHTRNDEARHSMTHAYLLHGADAPAADEWRYDPYQHNFTPEEEAPAVSIQAPAAGLPSSQPPSRHVFMPEVVG